jgi:hypothetical protein
MMVAAGVCGAALLAGAGLAMSARDSGKSEAAASSEPVALVAATDAPEAAPTEVASLEPATAAEVEPAKPVQVAAAPKPKRTCTSVASAETGFDPATTPYPVREDVGNRQVLKGAAVGAAAGAVGGEVIVDRAVKGAMVGAAAGAIGGHVIKKKKQKEADERYDAEVAHWQQSKARYDAALQTCLAS